MGLRNRTSALGFDLNFKGLRLQIRPGLRRTSASGFDLDFEGLYQEKYNFFFIKETLLTTSASDSTSWTSKLKGGFPGFRRSHDMGIWDFEDFFRRFRALVLWISKFLVFFAAFSKVLWVGYKISMILPGMSMWDFNENILVVR
ncbi:hypothetical protein C1645_881370 [Glomus cerebriforme]|uniref:Uncharacterized protein n=1 Tax=Glomus cerebriforme TaxID=658196 RepID=A0A397SCX1_9GLOM|nr:hypothetical protein C1645_881370 [Glomus cerebriforme]